MKLTESIHVNTPPEKIFDLTQDYGRRLEWDTFLKKAELINTNKAAVGEKAWCVSKHGLGMETVYVSFNRPKVTAIKQSKTSLLFKAFSGSWRFEGNNQEETKVTFTYSYSLNFPFNIASNYIHKVLIKNVKQRLIDLKACCERT